MTTSPSKALHISLWIAQILLAAAFGMAGFMKLTASVDDLAKGGMSFVNEYGIGSIRFIGISEVLGALGLILPSALRILPKLTSLAALGFSIIMVLATYYHYAHQEPIITTLAILAITLYIAWGRYKLAPIAAK